MGGQGLVGACPAEFTAYPHDQAPSEGSVTGEESLRSRPKRLEVVAAREGMDRGGR